MSAVIIYVLQTEVGNTEGFRARLVGAWNLTCIGALPPVVGLSEPRGVRTREGPWVLLTLHVRWSSQETEMEVT